MLADVHLTRPGTCVPRTCGSRVLMVVALVVVLATFHTGAVAGEDASRSTRFASSSPDSGLFQVGEELTYNVSYSVLDIGQVRIKILGKVRENDRTVYKAAAYIDSYKGLPFVNLHTMYESSIAESLFATRFRSRTRLDDGEYRYFIYSIDYPRGSIFIEHGLLNAGKVEGYDTLRIDTLFQDGLSLFFYARSRVLQRARTKVPTVVSEEIGETLFDFRAERQGEEIDAVEYPVDVVYFKGLADFIGIFGLTGEFEGWFSNDEARVPILAKMKVLIGSIRIELVKWNRGGWKPPRYPGE